MQKKHIYSGIWKIVHPHCMHQYICCMFLLFFVPMALHAQQARPDEVLAKAEAQYPQEKIYLHTDKATYNAGETVWFKAYITADNSTEPLSKTIYAELINDKGLVLQRRMMPVVIAGAANDFIIPDSLPDTRLFIRAYTAWMLNFDSSLLYVKNIHIIPKKGLPKKNNSAESAAITLRFFPEGGDLLEGISSKIAFKAAGADGTPVELTGEILNNSNKVMASFKSVHDGMGYFTLKPLPGETYKAVWKEKNGPRKEAALPVAKKQGVSLSVSSMENPMQYTLTRPDVVDEPFTKFTVVAQMNQRLMYNAQINLTKKTSVTAPMEVDSMPDGVLQITVFNGAMIPVAERLVFVNHNNFSFITDIHLIEKNITKQSRSVVQLDVGGTLLSNLSISVTDADINPVTKNESTIFSEMVLSSDLKGYVYNAAYYFSSDDDSVKQHLDLVMLTNGWRRFKWEQLIADQWPQLRYQPEKHLAVQGKIAGLSSTQLYNKSITGILQVKSKSPVFLNIPVSNKGDFSQDELYFFDTARMYYQFSNDKDKTYTTLASFNFKSSFARAPLLNTSLVNSFYATDKTDTGALKKSANLANLLRQQQAFNKVETLQEVLVQKKQKSAKQKLDEEYTSGFFSGGDGYTFNVTDDPIGRGSTTLLQYLQGKVAGLQLSTTGGGSATWRGSNTSFFLNETQTDLGSIQSINMADVALVKVFRPPFFGAAGGGAGGAIAVYMKKGSANNDAVKGLPFTTLIGYSAVREFYAPDYIANPDPLAKDYRSTLYWNPNVHFDRNSRRITLPFFNSDNCKRFRVIVEGINEAGLLTREEKLFE